MAPRSSSNRHRQRLLTAGSMNPVRKIHAAAVTCGAMLPELLTANVLVLATPLNG